ncbi:MAG: hypothetical protein WKF77_05280 [Planctomycetaceae bacterium]
MPSSAARDISYRVIRRAASHDNEPAVADVTPSQPPKKHVKPEKGGVRPDPYFTPSEDFRDVSRGTPLPHSLSDDQKVEVGLTRETWQLEVISDPDNPAKIGKPLTKADGTALDFAALLKLGETHAVRFPKVMTCLNLGCPLGMGLWEGVPLREVIWLTKPREVYSSGSSRLSLIVPSGDTIRS